MTWWGLLIEVSVVWLIWGLAAAVGRAVEEARRGVPEGRRGGVSLAPVIPAFPLVFWGAARLADLVIAPWGTLAVGWSHAALGLALAGSLARDWWRLRSLDEAAR